MADIDCVALAPVRKGVWLTALSGAASWDSETEHAENRSAQKSKRETKWDLFANISYRRRSDSGVMVAV
jgi:hypothetical protein